MTFLTAIGAPIVKEKTVPANGRLTVNIESEDPALANAAVSTQIDAIVPVIVERAQYWPIRRPSWYEAHNSFGVTAAGTKWGLAEGRAGGDAAYQTYILIANPGATAARRDGHVPARRRRAGHEDVQRAAAAAASTCDR